jgi:hypothetical protein
MAYCSCGPMVLRSAADSRDHRPRFPAWLRHPGDRLLLLLQGKKLPALPNRFGVPRVQSSRRLTASEQWRARSGRDREIQRSPVPLEDQRHLIVSAQRSSRAIGVASLTSPFHLSLGDAVCISTVEVTRRIKARTIRGSRLHESTATTYRNQSRRHNTRRTGSKIRSPLSPFPRD